MTNENKKTLFERLESDIKYKLDRVEELYPNSINGIYKELHENYYFRKLTYDCIIDLVYYCELKDCNSGTIKNLFIDTENI